VPKFLKSGKGESCHQVHDHPAGMVYESCRYADELFAKKRFSQFGPFFGNQDIVRNQVMHDVYLSQYYIMILSI